MYFLHVRERSFGSKITLQWPKDESLSGGRIITMLGLRQGEWWGCVLIALILWSHKGWFFMLCWVWNRRSEIFPQFPDPKPHSQQSTSGTSPKLRPRNLPQITPSSWGTLGWCFYYQISVLEIPHLLSSTIEAKIAGFRNKPHLLCLG